MACALEKINTFPNYHLHTSFSYRYSFAPPGYLETNTRFWEFKIESGITTYVRFGKKEPDGKLKERATQIQHHQSSEDARQFIEKMIDDKINAGYVGWAEW
ncbi:2364_t:CDS:2 [Ambispora gerdemannii]|uniref:2364_t:CDS:1 n=1 Tax=Ambispora gerdemannii TaxID=144530 RepID=A0A9N9B9F5_9GLOM|nr:2364_t:CDS:2 [Ambispora gerdemannii]